MMDDPSVVVSVALTTGMAMLALLVAGLIRLTADLGRRLDGLERAQSRGQRREPHPIEGESAGGGAAPDGSATEEPHSVEQEGDVMDVASEGDAVDVRGVTPDGRATTVDLIESAGPTLLAFLSTSCGICAGLWQRLHDGGLAAVAPTVRAVVVTKDAEQEDVGRIQTLAAAGAELPVVLSGEAWDDYEVPGSPYFLLMGGRPAGVLAEGTATRWEDVEALVRRGTSS